MLQFQHSTWVVAARQAVLSVIAGGGKWVEIACAYRPALSAPYRCGGGQVLAPRRERRASDAASMTAAHRQSPVQHRPQSSVWLKKLIF